MIAALLSVLITTAVTQKINVDAKTYEDQPATQKREVLWEAIEKTEYQKGKYPKNFGWLSLPSIFHKRFLAIAFTHPGDFMLQGRKKVIHTFGSTAKALFLPAKDTPYTGLLSQETEALVRISTAIPTASFTPGMAVKFFVDNNESRNTFAMHSLDGQGKNKNLFAHPWTTHIEVPKTIGPKLLVGPFTAGIKLVNPKGNPFQLPVSHLANINKDGSKVLNPKFPKLIQFVPMIKGIPSDTHLSLRQQLDKINYRPHVPNGNGLFKLYGKDSLSDTKGHFLGTLILESSFVASKFGDESLYFRHQD